jgi:purine-binding chemotaxis protein CheW
MPEKEASQAVQNNKQEQDLGEYKQYLSFYVQKELFAISVMWIKEIIGYEDITRVPMMPDFIEGVINLRGNVVPVVNLALRFGRKKSELSKTTSIIIVDLSSEEGIINVGLTVDAVDEVMNIPLVDMEKAPEFGSKIRSAFLEGIGKVDKKFIMLLNMETVVNIEELASHNTLAEDSPLASGKKG